VRPWPEGAGNSARRRLRTDSASVVLAGPSHAGKSTLCTALMTDGLYCYSDDSAVIDDAFRVAGMPFPLMLRKSSWPILKSRLAEPESINVHHRSGIEAGFLPSNLPESSSPQYRSRLWCSWNIGHTPGLRWNH